MFAKQLHINVTDSLYVEHYIKGNSSQKKLSCQEQVNIETRGEIKMSFENPWEIFKLWNHNLRPKLKATRTETIV